MAIRKLPRRRWFLDTEFEDRGNLVVPISIGLVSEDGAELYWEYDDYSPKKANAWMKEHVLPKLTGKKTSRTEIVAGITEALLDSGKTRPEVWAYYASYDWFVFCSTFGGMLSVPEGLPQYCREFMQYVEQAGMTKGVLPKPDPATRHNALEDAKWLKSAFKYVERG